MLTEKSILIANEKVCKLFAWIFIFLSDVLKSLEPTLQEKWTIRDTSWLGCEKNILEL